MSTRLGLFDGATGAGLQPPVKVWPGGSGSVFVQGGFASGAKVELYPQMSGGDLLISGASYEAPSTDSITLAQGPIYAKVTGAVTDLRVTLVQGAF